jgi:exo-beta-1,3-glucanase (GH17 family)
MPPCDSEPAAVPPGAARRGAVLLLLSLVLALILTWAVLQGRPAALPEVAAGTMSQIRQLPCVSYAPFRRDGDTPFDPALRIAPVAIEADLRLLKTVTGCLRTYGLDHGLDAVPAIARKLGLRVVLGAWIGRDAAANEIQLRRALELAREYHDVVKLLVVGNEVLLRRELAPEALAALLQRARRESPVPVSYADVWEFWLRHGPVLREHVDVVAAHILPYWEDYPVGSKQAVDHVYTVAAQLRQNFGSTPVFVAETGWPAAGRQRGPAVPGRFEQAHFVRGMLARQATAPLEFNLIEAFDQPWKRALEGAMGGAWGLFDSDGIQRVPLSGPLPPDPRWFWLPLAVMVGAVVGLMAGWWRRSPSTADAASARADVLAQIELAAAGGLIAAFAMLQAQALPLWSRNAWEWAVGGTALLLSLICGAAAAGRLAQVLQHGVYRERVGVAGIFTAPAATDWRLLAVAQFGLLFLAAVDALGLVFDARYRPLPWPVITAPALLLLALAWLGDRLPAAAREEKLLGAVCAVCAVLVVILEGPANTQALLYAVLLLALASASGWPHRAAPGVPGTAMRNSASPASSAAGAAQRVE